MARRIALALLGMLAFLGAGELLMRALPVSTSTETGYHFDPLVLSYPAHHQWRVATGWDLRNAQRLRSNNAGFVAEHDFVPNANAVALVGDSFTESSMLPAQSRPGAQLERALGGKRPVYAMGSPGTALLDYAERIRWASQQWGVRDFVVLMERGDVQQALCGSGNVHAQCLEPRTLQPRTELMPPPSTTKQWLRRSALAQYLVSQLKVEPGRLWAQVTRQQPRPAARQDAPAPRLDMVTAVAGAFFDRVRPYATGRLVIIIDGDRQRLARGESVQDPERDHFIALARAAGALVVDAEPLQRKHFARSQLSLDVGPYDRHLNALGIGMLMDATATALLGNAP